MFKSDPSNKKTNLNWTRRWNPEDKIERVVFSDQTLQEIKDKTARSMLWAIKREKNKFMTEVASKYTPTAIKAVKVS